MSLIFWISLRRISRSIDYFDILINIVVQGFSPARNKLDKKQLIL